MRLLCFLIEGYGGEGGIPLLNRDLLEALSLHPRVSEIVVLPRRAVGALGLMPEKISYDRAAASSTGNYLLRAARHVLGEDGFDLVACTHVNLQPIAAVAAKRLGARSLLLLHGFEAWSRPGRWWRRYGAGDADLFLGVSQVTLDRFCAWSGAPAGACRVLPGAVDLERYTPGPPSAAVIDKYRLRGKRPLLTLARLAASEAYKGVDEMLAALGAVLRQAPDVVYVVAGAGDDLPRLQANAASLGLAENLRFTGYIPEAEKIDLYRSARGFALAGYGEGFGIVLLEAMACGIPVLASTLDGSYEAVKKGRLGAAVDPRDRDALAAAVLSLLERPLGERPAGLEEFSLSAFRARVHLLLDAATEKGM